MDNEKVVLTNGKRPEEQPDFAEHKENGQQRAYMVLTEEERAKGFVRPLRMSYVHAGARPRYPLRDLTEEEHVRLRDFNYVAFEEYPESEFPKTGRFWTEDELQSGCGHTTTISQAIAETYARDPKFYGGTFCVHCGAHFPVQQFTWAEDGLIVGS